MAVRFSGSGQYYSSTSGLPTVRLFTVVCWICLVSDRNSTSVFWSMDSSSSQSSYLGTASDGTTLAFDWSGGGSSFTPGSTMTVGEWHRTAVVVNGTSALLYQGSATGALTQTAELANYGLPTGTLTFYLGNSASLSSSWWPDARIAGFKMWDAALTSAEVEKELSRYQPQRWANINRWHPLVNAEVTDYSGYARTLSGGSGATTEVGPPIPWSAYSSIIIPWSATTTVWYAHYDTTSGVLLSLGTVYPDPFPSGTSVLELLGQPDLAQYEWSTSARSFVLKEGVLEADRVADLVSDASLSSVWAALDNTQDAALQARIAQMLGPHRTRLDFQPPDLE